MTNVLVVSPLVVVILEVLFRKLLGEPLTKRNVSEFTISPFLS